MRCRTQSDSRRDSWRRSPPRSLPKLGGLSELELAEAQRDVDKLELLRTQLASLRQLLARADDREMALASDLPNAALEACALAKVFATNGGLEALEEAVVARSSHKRKPTPVAAA